MATTPDEEGMDLSPDAPIGVPVSPGSAPDPAPAPMPDDGGVIGPGPTPESR